MYYIDSSRTLTRRESSLITPKRIYGDGKSEFEASTRGQSTIQLTSDSGMLVINRPKGTVEREVVTMLFESMIDSIVESWEVIDHRKVDTSSPKTDLEKMASEITLTSKKKKPSAKPSKTKKSRSKMEMNDATQGEIISSGRWTSPDERAIIRFRNGNVYEGNLSMKCMHGEGRFQWTNGTVYLGHFKENEINGRGLIYWKDDTWYEGDFLNNLRHGKGLYVDSRRQRSYAGGWTFGSKDGQGVIYYSRDFKCSYDGDWEHNVRHGYGAREYCSMSGYKGQWDKYIREGKGLMIWPNHDVSNFVYRGEWKNGAMSGYGIYIWDAHFNYSMALPSISAYRGYWENGLRNGYGVMNFGSGLGSNYKGEFRDNKKHGVGKLVTNNGLILQDKHLFIDDNLGSLTTDEHDKYNNATADSKRQQIQEPYAFDLCDDKFGLIYHVERVFKKIDKQHEIRTNIINDFLENNKKYLRNKPSCHVTNMGHRNCISDLIVFEERALENSIRCYEIELKNIYYKYATICNTEETYFTPILIRLFLWQFYYDCNIHEKNLTLSEIDKMFYENPEWLAQSPHNPFEKIYFWQFVHSLISVADRLYAKRQLPGPKPNTILADGFRYFMENDILPGAGRCKGRLTNGYGTFVPLQSVYKLYLSLGEPCTLRTFLQSVRYSPHSMEEPRPTLVEAEYCQTYGRNVYVIGDEISYVSESPYGSRDCYGSDNLKLFNFCNLTNKCIIRLFSRMFPQVYEQNKIMDLDIEITFFEFFEIFITCAEESIHVNNYENNLPETMSGFT